MVTIIKKGAKKEEIEKALSNLIGIKKFDAYKFCGVINLQENALDIQKKMRHEWE